MRTVSATKNRILLYGLDWFTEQHDAGMVCVKGNVRYRDAVYEGAAFCRLVASAAADAGAFGEFVRELNGCFAIVLQRGTAHCVRRPTDFVLFRCAGPGSGTHGW